MQAEIAFVVDALAGTGGAEKVLMAALEVFPGTPVYALVYNPGPFTQSPIAHSPITTSFINRLPLSRRHYRSYLPLMPLAVEGFDLSRFERVVSFSYAAAHGVRSTPGQIHLSYTHTPMRYAWRSVPLRGTLSRWQWLADGILRSFRKWDFNAANRVDQMGAISHYIAGWIQFAYQRDAAVFYPPVDVDRFQPLHPRGDYYITVSRLVAHKRLDLIVEAFTNLKLPLVVVGEGPELAHLRKIAGPNITFAGYQDDAAVAGLLGRARAFVYASEEDFGIAIVEAQAAGCPVIAFGRGGAAETVCEGSTGLLFREQSASSLLDAVEKFERQARSFDEGEMVKNARRFNKERFKDEFLAFVYQNEPLAQLDRVSLPVQMGEKHSITGQSLPG